MASIVDPTQLTLFLSTLIILLQNVVDAMVWVEDGVTPVDDGLRAISVARVHNTVVDMNTIIASVLHDFRIAHANSILDDELGWWVKPRSTTWFSQFLLHEYDDDRWIQNFCFTKAVAFHVAGLLRPHVERMNTKYRKAIPVSVRLAITLYKLCQGASLLICSEFFAISKSTVSGVLRDVVHVVNLEFRHEISFPRVNRFPEVMNGFQALCGLPSVAGAIDGTHIHIRKPQINPEDYFYFKSGGYSVQCQVVVDNKKRFLDLAVRMPGSTHDIRVLRRSGLVREAQTNNLLDVGYSMDGFTPYLLGDKGYLLKTWLMTPFWDFQGGNQSILERLYNRKLSRGRSVVENAFGVLKQSFRELLDVSDLHVTFIPDLVVCCALLHDVLLGQNPLQVQRLLDILVREGMVPEVKDNPEEHVAAASNEEFERADVKRNALALYLGRLRNLA